MNTKILRMLGTIVLSICTINVFAQGQITMFNPSPTIVGSNIFQDVSGSSTNGFIGVNTTTPVNQLDVAGTAQATFTASTGDTYYLHDNSSLISSITGISGIISVGEFYVPASGTAFKMNGIADFTAAGGSITSTLGHFDFANGQFYSFEANPNVTKGEFVDGSGVEKRMELNSSEAKIGCDDNNTGISTFANLNSNEARLGLSESSGSVINDVYVNTSGLNLVCTDATNSIANVLTVNQDATHGMNFQVVHSTDTADFTLTPTYGMTVNCDGYVNGNWAWSSDARYKKDVAPITNALDKVLQLKGVYYDFKTDEFKDHHFPSNKQVGFIAQDVQKVFPEVVMTGKDGYLAIQYHKVVPLLVEGIKDQQTQFEQAMKQKDDQIAELSAKIDKKDDQIDALMNRLDKLEKTVSALSQPDNTQSVGINGTNIPVSNELLQNKPNPFNNSTTIEYNIADNASNSYIQIEDINGNTIKQINIKPGKGNIELSFSDLPAQTMLYSLYVNNNLVSTKKMIKQ